VMIPLLFFLLLAAVVAYHLHFAVRRKPTRTWQKILSEIEQVNKDGLQLIADCYLQPDSRQLEIEPPLMWELLGGHDGLKHLCTNASLMMELAVVAEQWDRVEGTIIAEMLRRDALRIRKSVQRLRLGMLWNGASVSVAFNLQEAVSSYCLMRGRLIGLYQNVHIALLPQLEAAL